MVDYIFNETSWEADYDNRPARVILAKTLLENEVTVPQGTYLYSIGGFTVAGKMLELDGWPEILLQREDFPVPVFPMMRRTLEETFLKELSFLSFSMIEQSIKLVEIKIQIRS